MVPKGPKPKCHKMFIAVDEENEVEATEKKTKGKKRSSNNTPVIESQPNVKLFDQSRQIINNTIDESNIKSVFDECNSDEEDFIIGTKLNKSTKNSSCLNGKTYLSDDLNYCMNNRSAGNFNLSLFYKS